MSDEKIHYWTNANESGRIRVSCQAPNYGRATTVRESVTCIDCLAVLFGSVTAAPGDNVNHPSHYTWLGGIEVIDITEHMGFCLGNVVKYVLRADHKGEPIQDLEKAAWYLAREIENRKKRLT